MYTVQVQHINLYTGNDITLLTWQFSLFKCLSFFVLPQQYPKLQRVEHFCSSLTKDLARRRSNCSWMPQKNMMNRKNFFRRARIETSHVVLLFFPYIYI